MSSESNEIPQHLLELNIHIQEDDLCDRSEGIFLDILDQQGKVVIVNNAFLVKGAGKLIGLCLRNVRNADGEIVFHKGNFYTPVGSTRQKLLENFGITHEADTKYELKTKESFMRIPDAEWIFLRRNMRKDVSDFMVTIYKKLATKKFLPDKDKKRHATLVALEQIFIPPYTLKNPLSKKSV